MKKKRLIKKLPAITLRTVNISAKIPPTAKAMGVSPLAMLESRPKTLPRLFWGVVICIIAMMNELRTALVAPTMNATITMNGK